MKLKLHLDDLSVDSFDTSAAEKPRGTVFGEQCTCWTDCSCPGCPSCDETCPATCGHTCQGGTCGNSCDWSCDASCDCNTWDPCTTALYTACGGMDCV